MAIGQIQGSDLKTSAQLNSEGLTDAALPHTDQVYDPVSGQRLDQLFASGTTAAPGVIGSQASPQIVTTQIDISAQAGHPHVIVFIQGLIIGDTPLLLADITGGTYGIGQVVEVVGTSDASTVSLADGHNGPVTLGLKKSVIYMHNGTEYFEKGRN